MSTNAKKAVPAAIFVVPFLLVAFALFLVATGRAGLTEVKDNEVALIVNYLTGSVEEQFTPGNKIFIPVIQEVFTFDKSPNKFFMKGNKNIDENTVKQLEVRANDGSNFWFEELEIQYKLIPGSIGEVVHDSGREDAFKINWLRSYARSILRDEFGRYSAEQIADPTTYEKATADARERLNDELKPHGIDIIQIVTPKPKFDTEYEKAIEDRKLANQEVEKLKARLEQLTNERERRLANIERDKSVFFENLLGELEAKRIEAEKERVALEKSADAAKITAESEGKAEEARLTQEARGLEEKYRREAEGLKAQADALAAQGEIIVRETLAAKLRELKITLIPYSKDSLPKRIEYDELRKKGGK